MDVREMALETASFDVAIDKGMTKLCSNARNLTLYVQGTMDAMMTAKADVWVSLKAVHHRLPGIERGCRILLKK